MFANDFLYFRRLRTDIGCEAMPRTVTSEQVRILARVAGVMMCVVYHVLEQHGVLVEDDWVVL